MDHKGGGKTGRQVPRLIEPPHPCKILRDGRGRRKSVTARGGATDPAGTKLLPLEVNEGARDLSPLDGSARRPALPTLRGLSPSFNIYLSAASPGVPGRPHNLRQFQSPRHRILSLPHLDLLNPRPNPLTVAPAASGFRHNTPGLSRRGSTFRQVSTYAGLEVFHRVAARLLPLNGGAINPFLDASSAFNS